MKHPRRRFFMAELCPGWWFRVGLLALGWLHVFGPIGLAQTIPPIVIPIVKERVKYYNVSEDGLGISCGIKLYGSFPVYKGRTNISDFKGRTNLNDYRIFIPGVQNPGSWHLDADNRFRFYAYFNGADGPASGNPECNYNTIGEDLPDWHAEYQPKRPVASFTATAVASGPGEWDFLSTSTDAEEQPLIEQWVFGDGTDGSGKKASHRYAKPGPFTTYLTVTDTDGLTNRNLRNINVLAPKALVSLKLLNKHPLNQIEIDEVFDVLLTVQASGDGVGALSELFFNSTNSLKIPSQFKVLEGSNETNIGTLQPGKDRTFTWKLKATNAGEFALVAAGVRGKDAAGRTVAGVGETELGEVTSLIVGITQNPPRLKLGADNNGDGKTNELDAILKIVVGITNVSQQDVVGVESSNVNDPIKFTSLAEYLNVWVKPEVQPSGIYGTIRPGVENAVLQTNTYIATDRTYAEAKIVLHGKTGDATVGAAGIGTLNVGSVTLLEARIKVDERPYNSGQTVRLFGSVTNVSRFRNRNGVPIDEGKTIGFLLIPRLEGNGAGGFIQPANEIGGPTPIESQPFYLAPGEGMAISAIIPTVETTNTSTLNIKYDLYGYIHEPDITPTEVAPTDLEIVEDSIQGWSAHHTVKLGPVAPITDLEDPCTIDLPFGWEASCNLVEGLRQNLRAWASLKTLLVKDFGELHDSMYRLLAYDVWMFEQAAQALIKNDQEATKRLITEAEINMKALKRVGVKSLQSAEVTFLSVQPAVFNALDEQIKLYREGGFAALAARFPRFVGENIDLPMAAMAGVKVASRIVSTRLAERELASVAVKEALQRELDDLPNVLDDLESKGKLHELPKDPRLVAGINVLNQPRVLQAYGILEREIKAFLQVAREENVIIAFRSRSPRAAELMEKGLHLLKSGGISMKTANKLDVDFFGVPEHLEAECVVIEPPIPWIHPSDPGYEAAINDYVSKHFDMQSVDPAVIFEREQVAKRLKFQLKEWPKQLDNLVDYMQNGIDVNFHAQKQKVGPGRLILRNDQIKRAAKVEAIFITDQFSRKQRAIYRLLMEDAPGSRVFKAITGDIDLIAILNADGTMPNLLKRLKVYGRLIDFGMQHGESFSYYIKRLREDWLNCCAPVTQAGGEGQKMLAATPEGQVLTSEFRDNVSLIEGGPNNALAVGEDQFAFFVGTISEINSPSRIAAETSSAVQYEVAPLVTAAGLAKLVGVVNAEIDRTGGTKVSKGADGEPQTFEAPTSQGKVPNSNAEIERTHFAKALPVLRRRNAKPAADPELGLVLGKLAELESQGYRAVREIPPPGAAGGQWRPVSAESLKPANAGVSFKVAPYTYLTDHTLTNTIELPIATVEELGFPSGSQFFAVGDRVVVDPGGPAETIESIVSLRPFTLSRPLTNAYDAGTMVLFLRGISNALSLPGALPAPESLLVWLRADAGLSVTNGTNVISWTDQSRNGFVFTAPTAATRPAWVTDSAPGVPAVRFNGASTPRLQGNLGRTLTNATIFTVARYLNNSTGGRYIYAFGTINYSGLMMTLGRNDGDNAYHYDGAAGRVALNAIPGTGFRVFSQVYGGDRPDSHQLAVDGHTVIESRTTVGRAYSAVATNVVLGKYVTATFGFTGDLAEWIVYDRALSTSERLEVEEYLRQRAQLAPVAPPGSLDVGASEILDYDVTAAPAVAWSLDLGNRQLKQAGAGDPSLALSGFAESGQVIRTKLRGSAGSGALGVVFGYQHRGQFHLFDWRQTASNAAGWGTAPAGMRLRTFHLPAGAEPTGADFWSGLDLNRVTTWRTNAVPWVADREYEVVLRLGEDATVVEVNFGVSNLETWIVPELKGISGRFGHYANSMPEARFGPVLLPGEVPLITGIEPGDAGNWTVRWLNGVSPFVLQSTTDLASGDWYPVAPATLNYSRTIQALGETQLFRIRSGGVVPDSSGVVGSVQSQTFGNNGRLWLIKGTGPTRIEAENFDEGGEGIAYHDTTAQNALGGYRTESVDIGATSDFGGGFAVGNIAAGEWLEYMIRVEAAGAYRLRARTARGQSGTRTLRVLFDGVDKTGNLVIPATGNSASYATVESDAFELTAGTHILRADLAAGGFDLNWIEIAPDQPVVQTTFGNNGNPWSIDSAITTRIEAENFDQGGQDVAYHETTPQNAGGAYRAEAVDIQLTTDTGGGFNVTSIEPGEWLEYTMNVAVAGTYQLRFRTARAPAGSSTLRVLVDGVDKTGNVTIPRTVGAQTWTTVTKAGVSLEAGIQTLRIEMVVGSFNLNWIEIAP